MRERDFARGGAGVDRLVRRNRGDSALGEMVVQQLADGAAGGGIEGGQRLVQNPQRGGANGEAGERSAAALPARERATRAVGVDLQTRERVFDSPGGGVVAAQIGGEAQVFGGGELVFEGVFVADEKQASAVFVGVGGDIAPAPKNGALIGLAQTGERLQQSGFTGAVGALDAQPFAAMGGERKIRKNPPPAANNGKRIGANGGRGIGHNQRFYQQRQERTAKIPPSPRLNRRCKFSRFRQPQNQLSAIEKKRGAKIAPRFHAK